MNPDLLTRYVNARQLVDDVELCLVRKEEQPLWEQLMSKHHYLGFRGLVGESLRYVAVYKRHWIALLGWAAPALSCNVPDQWIGWPHTLKWQRLALPANNSRFLILPGRRTPNLASRILALNVKRLSQDWQRAYGHPIRLAETFVDPRFFQGTCYKRPQDGFVRERREALPDKTVTTPTTAIRNWSLYGLFAAMPRKHFLIHTKRSTSTRKLSR